MREAVVVASSRTPLAKSFRGSFNMTRPDDLAAHCIKDVLGKVAPARHEGSRGRHPRLRPAARRPGPERRAGGGDAGRPAGDAWPGRPSTGSAPRACRPSRWRPTRSSTKAWTRPSAAASKHHDDGARQQAPTRGSRSRSPASTWSWATRPRSWPSATRSAGRRRTNTRCSSQQRTARAQQEGFFKEEMAPMQVTRARPRQEDRREDRRREYYVEKDECNRADTTLEGLLGLKPHFDKTAGRAPSPPATRRSCPTAPRPRC